MLLHLKKIAGSTTGMFPIGYEVVGEPVDENGCIVINWKKIKAPIYLKLPSSRFSEKPFQFKTDEIVKIENDVVITYSGKWKFSEIT